MIALRYFHLVGFLCCAFAQLGAAQDDADKATSPSGKEWLDQRTQEMASYQFALEGTQPKPLAMEERSVLNWSNAERGTKFGAVFLWTNKGLPAVIACAYGRGQWLRHEFHSLSTEPIIGKRGGLDIHSFQPGIEWRELVGAPQPSASRPLRLAQMRRQAERFRATVVLQPRADAEPKPAELRLLTQPVYRTPESAAEDVAIFLYVQGTDPECVLLLGIKPDKTWRYALARQTMAGIKAELDGKLVFEAPHRRELTRNPQSPFVELTPPEAKPMP